MRGAIDPNRHLWPPCRMLGPPCRNSAACRRSSGQYPQPMVHSVSDHLHVRIAEYDRFIRTVIPHYETMRAVQLELLARSLPRQGRVVDLGGGTGALARAVAEKFSDVRVEIWDTDPAMLEVARERCVAFADRVGLGGRSFAD